MSKFLIYGLVDPRDGQLRYVGKTSRSAAARLYNHVWRAGHGDQTHRSKWIRSLLKEGQNPELEVLEVVPDEALLNEAEVWHIAYWRSLGCRLTNHTEGGEGTRGWSPSPEWRKKRSDYMRGRQYSLGVRPSAETRKRLSESHRGKTTGPHALERRIKNSRSQGGRPVIDSLGNRYETAAEAARSLGLKQAAISAVLLQKRKSHHGFTFRYEE